MSKKKKEGLTAKEVYRLAGVTKMPERRTVELSSLRIDDRYQRVPSSFQLSQMEKDFEPACCGHLVVNKRENGQLFLVDGNHRRICLEKLGIKSWKADYFQNLSPEKEAHIWVICNTARRNATAVEKFKQRLFVKEPVAIAIKAIVRDFDCHLVLERRPNRKESYRQIVAVAALERIWKRCGEPGLREVLDIITKAWPETEAGATDGVALIGLMIFLNHRIWKGKISKQRLIEKLSGIPVIALIRFARGHHETGGGDIPSLFADGVWREYNKRLSKKNRLPPRSMAEDDE